METQPQQTVSKGVNSAALGSDMAEGKEVSLSTFLRWNGVSTHTQRRRHCRTALW